MYRYMRAGSGASPSKVASYSRKPRTAPGFTIVELLVVIVVIGILATITIVSYSGITSKATVASLQSDLDNASRLLKMYSVEYGNYPTALDGNNCPSAPTVDSKYCLKSSSGNTFTYAAPSSSPQSFTLVAANNTTSYRITNSTAPEAYNVTPGAVLELRASTANGGISPGIDSPFTTTWKDTSGNGNNGTLANMAGTTSSGWAGSGTGGDPYRAVFDATDDYVDLGTVLASVFSTKSYTIETWQAWPYSTTNQYPSLMGHDGAFANGTYIALNSGVLIGSCTAAGTNVQVTDSISHRVDDGAIHQTAVTVGEGGKVKLYADGAAVGTPLNIPAGTFAAITVSRLGSDAWFNKAAWSFAVGRVYPFALSAAQVAANYAAGPN